MNRKAVDQQIQSELTDYFNQARGVKCPVSMKKNLYQKIGLGAQRSVWKPVLAFCFALVVVAGISWQQFSQKQMGTQAEKDMQIAMHYMEKIGFKALSDVNSHGLKPAIIVPVSKSMAKI